MAITQDDGALRGPRRCSSWVWTAIWGVAAATSIALLVVAIAGRAHGGGPTLRPMAASESMSDEQAGSVAANTARVWMRERNERHLANLEALSCPETHDGALAHEIDAVRHGDSIQKFEPSAVARFTRDGPVWTIDVFNAGGGGEMFIFQIRNGELLVCQIDSAPIP
ncbi:hypothetical protein A5634_21065 [Mycobacterium asiaticum]|uniref:Uncharacterized protein n=1 Tax=Mycobacterium asiaticum TaxID=1790 RepID=A0A1A3P6E8_MYCAS|nr:hypothetical protein [Mycobacterium asiaticum]OBK28167.1 hypothetical protein A5634_21065 [Mycobacterium asiaticum]